MKIVGQMVCGPNEPYLERTLNCFAELCDDVVVATCRATETEKTLLDKYDFRHYEDNREWGKDQPNIKTDLLRKIIKLGADWVLPLDADEEMIVPRGTLEELSRGRESCYFYIVNLWNDEQHYSRSLSFWNVRFYKADESKGVQFLRRPVHCGNAPPYFYAQAAKKSYVPHYVIHRGLLDPDKRKEKAKRYEIYDPRAEHKGREYYDALHLTQNATEIDYNKITESLYGYIRQFENK